MGKDYSVIYLSDITLLHEFKAGYDITRMKFTRQKLTRTGEIVFVQAAFYVLY